MAIRRPHLALSLTSQTPGPKRDNVAVANAPCRRVVDPSGFLAVLWLVAITFGFGTIVTISPPASAESAGITDTTRPIEELDATLLAVMKAGTQTNFSGRYQILAPVVDRIFDWNIVPQSSVGMRWSTMSPNEQTEFRDMLRRYTTTSYVANFDKYSGQRFQVSPAIRRLGNGDIIVRSQIVETSGSSTELDYVMRQTSAGWQAIDVLADGSISRIAVQRSDFRGLLVRGGVAALLTSLERKVTDLSGGALR